MILTGILEGVYAENLCSMPIYDGIIPADLPEFKEDETEGSFFLKRSQIQALASRLRKRQD